MRNFSILVISFFISGSAARAEDAISELVTVPITKAYIPVGFDDNDHVQVVVTGEFPDSCYQLGPVTAKTSAGGVEITQQAYRTSGVCLDMLVPFNQTVELNRVSSGNYEVKDASSGKRLGLLPVTVAKKPTADDFIYAPVEEVMILEERGGKGPTLYLTGNFPSKRMRIKEILVHNYKDVVVVQPIVEIVKGELAEESRVSAHPRFEAKQLLKNLPKGKFLLHVRSMNGKAINKMEELEGR